MPPLSVNISLGLQSLQNDCPASASRAYSDPPGKGCTRNPKTRFSKVLFSAIMRYDSDDLGATFPLICLPSTHGGTHRGLSYLSLVGSCAQFSDSTLRRVGRVSPESPLPLLDPPASITATLFHLTRY